LELCSHGEYPNQKNRSCIAAKKSRFNVRLHKEHDDFHPTSLVSKRQGSVPFALEVSMRLSGVVKRYAINKNVQGNIAPGFGLFIGK
jgi:hypothetical protein